MYVCTCLLICVGNEQHEKTTIIYMAMRDTDTLTREHLSTIGRATAVHTELQHRGRREQGLQTYMKPALTW